MGMVADRTGAPVCLLEKVKVYDSRIFAFLLHFSSKKSPEPEDATALFGPPLETAFEEQKTEGTSYHL